MEGVEFMREISIKLCLSEEDFERLIKDYRRV